MEKCNSYHLQPTIKYTYHPLMGRPIAHDVEVGVCWGTKECERCNCGGDRRQCDFYPEVREKAIRKDDSLIVTYDCCTPDSPTLCVARKEKDRVKVVNTIQGDQAFGMYHYLTGGAYLVDRKVITNADRIRAMTDDELADFFYGSPEEEFAICYYCKNFGGVGSPEPCKTPHGCCEVEAKNEAFKKWLKRPVTERE